MAKSTRIPLLLPASILAATIATPAVGAPRQAPAEPLKVEFDATGKVRLLDSNLLSRLGTNSPSSWDRVEVADPTTGPKVNMMCPCAPQGGVKK